jgi:hypothetical protein
MINAAADNKAAMQKTDNNADNNAPRLTTTPQLSRQCRNADNNAKMQTTDNNTDNNAAAQTTTMQHRQEHHDADNG